MLKVKIFESKIIYENNPSLHAILLGLARTDAPLML
jgi:hypothetical protein